MLLFYLIYQVFSAPNQVYSTLFCIKSVVTLDYSDQS